MKKTWSVVLKVIIAVAGAIAGVLGVQACLLYTSEKRWCRLGA